MSPLHFKESFTFSFFSRWRSCACQFTQIPHFEGPIVTPWNEVQTWICRHNTTYCLWVGSIESSHNFVSLEIEQGQTAVFVTGKHQILRRMTRQCIYLAAHAARWRIWDQLSRADQAGRTRNYVKEIDLWGVISSDKLTLLSCEPRAASQSFFVSSTSTARRILESVGHFPEHFLWEGIRGGTVPQEHRVVRVYRKKQVLEGVHFEVPNCLQFWVFFAFGPLTHAKVLSILRVPIRAHLILLWQTPNSNHTLNTRSEEHIFASTVWIGRSCDCKKGSRVASKRQIGLNCRVLLTRFPLQLSQVPQFDHAVFRDGS